MLKLIKLLALEKSQWRKFQSKRVSEKDDLQGINKGLSADASIRELRRQP
jgi:hypothetical protein